MLNPYVGLIFAVCLGAIAVLDERSSMREDGMLIKEYLLGFRMLNPYWGGWDNRLLGWGGQRFPAV